MPLASSFVAIVAFAVTCAAPLTAQQHSYTQTQIDEGRQLYAANCGRCHGDTGSSVTGVELFKQIRRATSDEDIAGLIQQGIPGTAMPPHRISNLQALSLVAFLRAMVNAAPVSSTASVARNPMPTLDVTRANAARGKALFTGKAGCVMCHRAEGSGGTTGPDLSAIGAPRVGIFFGGLPIDVPSLERALLDPSDDIGPAYRVYQATPKNGAPVRGRLLNQDTFSIQILDDAVGLRSFDKSELKEFRYLASPMPSYRERLSDEELADVIAYLLTLKGAAR
jgi:putative heme-binding domain-containing protein